MTEAQHTCTEQLLDRVVSKEEAKEAIKTLLRYIGEDTDREGLLDTPRRVIDSYKEFFAGYEQNPKEILSTTFKEVGNYDEVVLLKDITFTSHCEHHMVPFIGVAHVAYIPRNKVVGISKLARLVDAFARRLQIQERMTVDIAQTIADVLEPKGVAVIIKAKHQCMTTRGVGKPHSDTVTSCMRGLFREDPKSRAELMQLLA